MDCDRSLADEAVKEYIDLLVDRVTTRVNEETWNMILARTEKQPDGSARISLERPEAIAAAKKETHEHTKKSLLDGLVSYSPMDDDDRPEPKFTAETNEDLKRRKLEFEHYYFDPSKGPPSKRKRPEGRATDEQLGVVPLTESRPCTLGMPLTEEEKEQLFNEGKGLEYPFEDVIPIPDVVVEGEKCDCGSPRCTWRGSFFCMHDI